MPYVFDPCPRDFTDFEVCSKCLVRSNCVSPKLKFYDIERKC